jgi:superfamily II DNA or RNA helicase
MTTINSTGLLSPQVEHTKVLLDSIYKNGFAVDMSSTGTGKSYCAAAIIREMNRPAVVVCPKSVIPAWQKVLKSFGVAGAILINYEKLGRGNTKWMKWKKLQDLMRPWDEAAKEERPDFNFPRNAIIVLDEGHKCKGDHTSNSQMMLSLVEQGYKLLVMSATIATTPLEMKAFGYLAQLHKLYNFPDFCRIHGAQYIGRWGAFSFDAASLEAKKAMLALNRYLFKTRKCSSRLTIEDFGTLFPEGYTVAESYDLGDLMTNRCQQGYDEMEEEIAQLDKRTENYSAHIFAIITKARRHAELCKVPLFVEMIEDLFEEGKSVVCFVNFTATVEAIDKRLTKNKKLNGLIGHVVGGQSDKERQDDIDGFQADRKRILVTNIKAGGISISLHDLNGKFPRASIVSPNYSAYELIQALGRIWRQGGLTKVYQRVVFAARTVEEIACRRVQQRIHNLSALNDADLKAGIKLFD